MSEQTDWKSHAQWPRVPGVIDITESSDTHGSKEQAEAVCTILQRDGFGGNRQHFQLKTWVEEVKPERLTEAQARAFPKGRWG